MKLIDTETGHELVETACDYDRYDRHGRYASKGVAGAGLGLGIAGTALWLLSGGFGGNGCGLFGNRSNFGAGVGAGIAAATEKEDKCEMINGMWSLAYNGQNNRFNDRQTINSEMFGLYKSQVDADFGLYKSTRDSFDITNARVSELEKKVAVMEAIAPYQNRLVQCDIEKAYDHSQFNLFRRTCRMIEGDVVLPSTPTVTGFPSQRCCRNATATTPAEA